ncbi:MAG: VOC family protein [Actinomycetota bacterium]|nr:VOC family protein [Actinomycetota bacterium]
MMDVLSSRVLYRCRDFDALRTFYEDTLGLHPYREYGSGGTVAGVVLFLGGGFLELVRAVAPSAPLTLWLQVADAGGEEERLRQRGVTVVKPVERMPWGLVESWVEDPEGNELHLVEVPDDHPIRRRVDPGPRVP